MGKPSSSVRARAKRLPDVELKAHEDFSVLPHPFEEDTSWPKTRPVHRTRRYPLTFQGPKIELDLLPVPGNALTREQEWIKRRVEKRSYLPALTPTEKAVGLGDIWSDIFGFIKSIIDAILSVIRTIIEKIIEFFKNPLKVLREIFGTIIKFFTGALFLEFLENFPLTRWIFQGIDYITGGFLTNMRALTSLPGQFVGGEHISRDQLMKAIGALTTIATVFTAVITGGTTIAIISASAALLKNGPIGKTEIGRLLIDICSIGFGGLMGGADLISAFASAGKEVLIKRSASFIAEKTGVPPDLAKMIATGSFETITDPASIVATVTNPGALVDATKQIASDVATTVSDPGKLVDAATSLETYQPIASSPLVPEPYRLSTGAALAVASTSSPGEALKAAEGFAYSTLQDKSPVAALVYGQMRNPEEFFKAVSHFDLKTIDPTKIDLSSLDPTKIDLSQLDPTKVDLSAIDPTKIVIPGVDLSNVDPRDIIEVSKAFLASQAGPAGKPGVPAPTSPENIYNPMPDFKFDFKFVRLPSVQENPFLWVGIASALIGGTLILAQAAKKRRRMV